MSESDKLRAALENADKFLAKMEAELIQVRSGIAAALKASKRSPKKNITYPIIEEKVYVIDERKKPWARHSGGK